MTEMTIFAYRHGASILHRADPRCKTICLVMVSLASISADVPGLFLLTVVLAAMIAHVRLPLKSAAKTLRYVVVLLLFVFVARILFSPGTTVFELVGISITREGIDNGVLVCWRLADVIVVGLLYISSTRSSEVKAAVEWFLAAVPFIPAKRVGTMMSLLLRFLPVILDQARETADAQRARCVENRKNPIYRMRKWAMPLIRRTFERADKLTLAMEARCYSDQRTGQVLTSGRNDWVMLVSAIVLSVAMMVS